MESIPSFLGAGVLLFMAGSAIVGLLMGGIVVSLNAAQKNWRRLDGHNQLPKVVLGATFKDGLEVAVTAVSP